MLYGLQNQRRVILILEGQWFDSMSLTGLRPCDRSVWEVSRAYAIAYSDKLKFLFERNIYYTSTSRMGHSGSPSDSWTSSYSGLFLLDSYVMSTSNIQRMRWTKRVVAGGAVLCVGVGCVVPYFGPSHMHT